MGEVFLTGTPAALPALIELAVIGLIVSVKCLQGILAWPCSSVQITTGLLLCMRGFSDASKN